MDILNNFVFLSPQNPNSSKTVKDRKWPSYPIKYLYQNGFIKGKCLDFGCGLGEDVNFLKNKNINITGYDPYYVPGIPDNKFNTIVCTYVLNILLPEEQSIVLMAVSELLEYGGRAYFTVRRDIKKNGYRYNPKKKVKTYQCNVKLPFKSILKTNHCEIYEYQHNNLRKFSYQNDCIFCNLDSDRKIVTESALCFAMNDKFPVTEGHTLVIPKKHESNYFNLSLKVQSSIWLMVNRVRWIIENKLDVHDFNVGFNLGQNAGQTIEHVHIHVIPRYKNDVKNPIGGIRNVIPDKGDYLE